MPRRSACTSHRWPRWTLCCNGLPEAPTATCSDRRAVTSVSLGVIPRSVGIERGPASVIAASDHAPSVTVVHSDFFMGASVDCRRFDSAVGNPPFVRCGRFSGAIRWAAPGYYRGLGGVSGGPSASWGGQQALNWQSDCLRRASRDRSCAVSDDARRVPRCQLSCGYTHDRTCSIDVGS